MQLNFYIFALLHEVCGCDGRTTYLDACEAIADGMNVRSLGPCRSPEAILGVVDDAQSALEQ